MIHSIIELLRLLSPQQRRELSILQVLVILMAFAEIAGVASIGPFMALIGNIDILQQNPLLANLYQRSGLTSPADFIFWAGITAMITLALSALVSMLTLWRLAIFGNKVGIEIGNRLFEYYMHQPWLFHAGSSSAILTKKIAADTSMITNTIIQPLLSINARIVLAIFIAIPVIIWNPLVAITGLSIFLSAYLILYRLVRMQLMRNGKAISQASGQRFMLLSEGFGGIKDVLLLGRQENFIKLFKQSGAQISYGQGTNQTIGQAPRYFMEVLAFSSVIFLVLYLIKTHGGNLGEVLPTLAVYALAGFKLLPAFQNIYLGVASIRAALPSFDAIHTDLKASQYIGQNDHHTTTPSAAKSNQLVFSHSISLNNVGFTYPGKTIPALNDLNLIIPAKKVVGIVGATGSGKSTAIDMILGLINPDSGTLCIDNKPLPKEQIRNWQNLLGFVPQSIYLSNASLQDNVAFGLPPEQIDQARVKTVIRLSHLDELVSQLPNGIHTIVGERGVQLSGGQRQRIGIARALYNNAEVLILDEATSALDGITEKFIMQAIQDFSGEKTIVMIAHRFTTVQKCDIIYLMNNGSVVDKGTYNELLERNSLFSNMAMNI